MNLAELNKDAALRKGITTGTCSAAASLAAYIFLASGKKSGQVSLTLPGGMELDIPVSSLSGNSRSASASVVKDAGDDPDSTDKMKITVTVKHASCEILGQEDYLESCGVSFIIIRGGAGIGISTRPGLDVPPGKYAINPAPRKLIARNLELAGFGKEAGRYLLIEISAEDGENRALKTLNPALGINGGISILGISGIVEPYSNAAYIHSIRLQMRSIAAQGIRELALSTGTRTQKSFMRDNPWFPECACARIGDFIADSLKAALEAGLLKISVACMPGKLYKYACGHEYTHAHKAKLNPGLLAEILAAKGYDEEIVKRISCSDTVGEAASFLDAGTYMELMNRLSEDALANLKNWAGKAEIRIFLYDGNGSLILEKSTEKAKEK